MGRGDVIIQSAKSAIDPKQSAGMEIAPPSDCNYPKKEG